MEKQSNKYSNSLSRQLSNLKLISRLLGHELHNQSSAKTISLSRDEVMEIQTTIDLFIEEASKGIGSKSTGGYGSVEVMDVPVVPARN